MRAHKPDQADDITDVDMQITRHKLEKDIKI